MSELASESVGAGERVVFFVHGLTVDRRVMRAAFEPRFAQRSGWRRVYVDLPGHGDWKHVRTGAEVSADAWVERLTQLVSKERDAGHAPYLVGYSYGGYLVQGVTAAVGDVGGLFLLCPVVEPDFGKRRVPPLRVVEEEEALAFADGDEKHWFEEVAVVRTAQVLEAYRAHVYPAQRAVNREVVMAIRERYAMSRLHAHALRTFARPIAIACGKDDPWVGFEDAAALAAICPEASLTVAARAGHLLPFEAPRTFDRAVDDWVDRCEAT